MKEGGGDKVDILTTDYLQNGLQNITLTSDVG